MVIQDYCPPESFVMIGSLCGAMAFIILIIIAISVYLYKVRTVSYCLVFSNKNKCYENLFAVKSTVNKEKRQKFYWDSANFCN